MSEVKFFAFDIISRNQGNFYVVVDVCLWVQRLHLQLQVLLRLRLPLLLLLLLVMVVLLDVPLLFFLLLRVYVRVCREYAAVAAAAAAVVVSAGVPNKKYTRE